MNRSKGRYGNSRVRRNAWSDWSTWTTRTARFRWFTRLCRCQGLSFSVSHCSLSSLSCNPFSCICIRKVISGLLLAKWNDCFALLGVQSNRPWTIVTQHFDPKVKRPLTHFPQNRIDKLGLLCRPIVDLGLGFSTFQVRLNS